MDILNDILETLDLKGALYFRTDFSGVWSMKVPDLAQAARFHLVVEGACRVEFSSGGAVELKPGDLVMIPRGRSHVLADGPGRDAPPLETVLEETGYDGRGVLAVGDGDKSASTQMVCGHFSFRARAEHPILNALPDHLVITNAMRAREPWLDDMLRLVARRVFSEKIGSAASITRLSEIVFIEILRVGLGQSEDLHAVLEAFRDKQIGRALELIHQRPERAWTVETLAVEVGMSRSRFAERFSTLLGISPMKYLSEWRLQKALSLLDDTRHSIQQVAIETGYHSPAAFSRAFAGKFGVPPREYRRSPA